MVARGLRWSWSTRPPLRRPRRLRRHTPPSLARRLRELLRLGVIEPAGPRVFHNRVFEVPKKDTSESRVVLDASTLNSYIPALPFRMTSVATVREVLRPGLFLASLDLKDAYWHVPIAPRFRPFLAFSAAGRLLQFAVLPFGLNIAPRVFTKMMQPVHAALVREGVRILMYLDDWLVLARSAEECREMIETTLRVGRGMGVGFNLPKSHLVPSTSLQYLGLVWDTVAGTVALSSDNVARCRRKVFRAVHSTALSGRQWESLVGSLNHAAGVVPLGRIHVRELVLVGREVFRGGDRDVVVPFPRALRLRLRWWLRRGRLLRASPWAPPPASWSLTTDASDFGWGYQSSAGHQGAGRWSGRWRDRHINVRELRVVFLALRQETSLRQGCLHVFSDNVAAVHCLNAQGSSRSPSLLRLSFRIFRLAEGRGLHVRAFHLAGVENVWADALSRRSTASLEWALRQEVFDGLSVRFGRPDVDLFASRSNHRLPLFLSRAEVTAAGGPDALAVGWEQWAYIYLFPPPTTSLMLAVVRRLEEFRGKVLLIAPWWETQPWFVPLRAWCPAPVPLVGAVLEGVTESALMDSLRLHAWSFYLGPTPGAGCPH